MGAILTPAVGTVRQIDHAAADAAHAALLGALAARAAVPRDVPPAAQPVVADSFDPIRRSVSLFDALAAVDAKKPATDAARITALEAELARVCRLFEQTEGDLLVELQTALNETCNGYHDDGHADRVARVYGLRAEGV